MRGTPARLPHRTRRTARARAWAAIPGPAARGAALPGAAGGVGGEYESCRPRRRPPARGMPDEGNDEVPTVCLVGATGAGKSSTGNSLFGCRGAGAAFHVDEVTLDSVTSETEVAVRRWRGGGGEVRCVDTPGLGDSAGRDAENIAGLAERLKAEVRYVHAFVVVFNSQEPRLNAHLKEMLTTFKQMFGEGFLRHMMICFTRWEYDKRAKKKRARSGNSEESRASLMNAELRKLLGHDFDCPCVFLDNVMNACSTEELSDLYDDELEDIQQQFDAELEKVRAFVFAARPFQCQDVKAVGLEKEELKKKVMQLIQLVDERALGRKLITAETGVIHRGWLRWKRRWIWGVLRRQHLRMYTDEECLEPTGPREVDLTGCICSTGAEWHLFQRRFPAFTVYRPVNVQGAARSYFCHVFQVRTPEDRRRWVLLVQEATQISESCHRIEKFHDSLRVAPSRREYEKAMAIVVRETMVIPVEWVFQQSSALIATKGRKPTLQQAIKDLQRDRINVDGADFACPVGDDLAAHVCHRVLEGAGFPQEENAEVKAAVMARDVLLGCSRTQGGGDTFDAVQVLFGNNETLQVHVKPEAPTDPILVRVLCRRQSDSDVLCSISTDTGVPQFQRDQSAKHLSSELVRGMDLQGEQNLSSNAVNADSWVPDYQMVQCMRCGERFNPFLRRHHCRACGALVCYSCSRHVVPLSTAGSSISVDFVSEASDSPQVRCQRVCFLCYQKAVIRDLDARKERGQQAVVNEEELLSMRIRSTSGTTLAEEAVVAERESAAASSFLESIVGEENDSPSEDEAAEAEEEDSEEPWPAVSVEMSSRYKIVAMGPDAIDEWYALECKYVRVIRWSGLADEGRVFISVRDLSLNGTASAR